MIDPPRIQPGEAARLRRVEALGQRRQWLGSVGPFLIEINGRYRLFEFHGVCGPLLVDDKGESLRRQPAESSPFWKMFEAWRDAGCYVDPHNRAYVPSDRIMRAPPPLP